MKTRTSGFTLIELMITIALGAILLTLAISSLGNWVRESRMTRAANDIVLGALMARTEALKRRVPVSFCLTTLADGSSTADGAACVSRSAPLEGDAWMVFVDEDRNLQADVQADILRVVEVPPLTVKSNLAPTPAADEIPYIMFGADGFRETDTGADGVTISAVVLCDKRGNAVGAGGNSAARAVLVSPTGRSAVSRGTSEIKKIIDVQLGGASCKP